jgi:hypothetical protein
MPKSLKRFRGFLKKISKESFDDLLKRAAMNVYAFNTSVLLSKDKHFRIASRMGFNSYGDCISIEIMHEKTPGQWHYAHFSPARAKIFALQILERVEILENSDPGKECIDEDEDYKVKT